MKTKRFPTISFMNEVVHKGSLFVCDMLSPFDFIFIHKKKPSGTEDFEYVISDHKIITHNG